MNNELFLPIFWTVVFSILLSIGVRKLGKKLPTEKKWIRSDQELSEEKDD